MLSLLILLAIAAIVAGGAFAAPNLTAADIIKYGNLVAHEYNTLCPIGDDCFVVRDLNDANQCRIPVIVPRTASEVAAASSRIAGSSKTDKAITLTQNAAIEAQEIIPWETTKKLPWNILEQYGKRLAMDAVSAYILRVTNYLAGNVPISAPNHVVTGTLLAGDSGLATSVRNSLITAAGLLDLQNIPRVAGRRCGLIHPTLFNILFTLPEVAAKYYGGTGDVARFGGGYIEYADFRLWSSTAGFATDSSGMGDGNTPSKFKKNLADRDGVTGGSQAVYAVLWDSQSVAEGFATMGEKHIEIMAPWYEKQIKSWVLNTAMIMDISSIQQNGSSLGSGIVVLQDDGV